ncbi:MAG: hypothetical protein P4L71_08285 [Acetobacteraceae bacterium]|nr:hypothetical protein [Acetobacteraceae bacterium]
MTQIKAVAIIQWQNLQVSKKMERLQEALMAFSSILPNGTRVIASVDFGPIIKDQVGIIVARRRGSWRLWRRGAYVCTFLGDMTVVAVRPHILPHDHGCSLAMLWNPFWFLETRTLPGTQDRDAGEPRRPVPWAEWRGVLGL